MTPADERRIAEAATSGPWEAVTDGKPDFYGLPEWRIGNPAYPPVTCAGMTRESAEFIATFNPARVLELLDQIEQLQAVVRDQHDDCVYQARLAAVAEMHVPPPGLGPAYCTECDQLHPCDTTKAARGE